MTTAQTDRAFIAGESVDPLAFRATLGHYASGITIISSHDGREPIGFTCQSFYSVSVEPPLVSFSVMRTSSSYPRIRDTGKFVVNVLAHSQIGVSNQFAFKGTDKWAGIEWNLSRNGGPVIADTLMWLDCELHAEYEAGDHYIVVGRVNEMSPADWHSGEPLLYYKGSYRHLRDEANLTPPDRKSAVDLEGAASYLKRYHQLGDFPITQPLSQRPKEGSSVVFLKAATSVTNLQDTSLREAAQTMGMKYSSVDVGTSPEAIQQALESVVAMKPDAVVNVAINPSLFATQLQKLRDAGVVVVSGGIAYGSDYGFDAVVAGSADVVQTGKIMAAQAIVAGKGEVTSLVYYKTPELHFTTEMERGVKEGIEEFCDGCDLRVVPIPITEVGKTAAERIVKDLQANPGTQAAIASFNEIFLGLPDALAAAGLNVYTVGQAPVQATYEAIANGQQDATVAWDIDMMMWPILDQVARELAGEAVPDYQKYGVLIKQVVTAENLPDDLNRGWCAYQDFKDRFAALWAGA